MDASWNEIVYGNTMQHAERVRKYKPSVEVYRWVCQTMEVSPQEILSVTAHGWDIAGADNAGMQTAYIEQPDNMIYALSSEPGFVCKDLKDLSIQLREQF